MGNNILVFEGEYLGVKKKKGYNYDCKIFKAEKWFIKYPIERISVEKYYPKDGLSLADFLEYLFLIKDKELEQKFEEYKRERGGAVKMTVDQIRQKYYEQKGKEVGIQEGIEKGKEEGREEGKKEGKIEVAKNLLDVLDDETIALKTGLSIDEIKKLRLN
ncbi:hypothetical protein UT300005_13710 [Clostridium sp. CTA-5]